MCKLPTIVLCSAPSCDRRGFQPRAVSSSRDVGLRRRGIGFPQLQFVLGVAELLDGKLARLVVGQVFIDEEWRHVHELDNIIVIKNSEISFWHYGYEFLGNQDRRVLPPSRVHTRRRPGLPRDSLILGTIHVTLPRASWRRTCSFPQATYPLQEPLQTLLPELAAAITLQILHQPKIFLHPSDFKNFFKSLRYSRAKRVGGFAADLGRFGETTLPFYRWALTHNLLKALPAQRPPSSFVW